MESYRHKRMKMILNYIINVDLNSIQVNITQFNFCNLSIVLQGSTKQNSSFQ